MFEFCKLFYAFYMKIFFFFFFFFFLVGGGVTLVTKGPALILRVTFQNPGYMKEAFYITIETLHAPDDGERENVSGAD